MNIKQILGLFFLIIISNVYLNTHSIEEHNNTILSSENTYMNNSYNSPDSTKYVKYFFVFLSLIPLIGGLWGVNTWFKEYNLAKESTDWTKVTGIILVKTTSSGLTHSPASKNVYSESTRAICPQIEYKFKIADKTYKGTRINLSNSGCSTNADIARNILKQFPAIGEEVTVYYSEKHHESVLIPGANNTNYLWLVLTSMFLIVGLLFLRLALK